jgi:hypothetical protein
MPQHAHIYDSSLHISCANEFIYFKGINGMEIMRMYELSYEAMQHLCLLLFICINFRKYGTSIVP